jgi:uncharacterized membrane protein HdeD (DUF308 family)
MAVMGDEQKDKWWLIFLGLAVFFAGCFALLYFNSPLYGGIVIFTGLALIIVGVGGSIEHMWAKAMIGG